MACSVDGCENPSYIRGYCNAHYKRWRRYGSPHIMRKRFRNPESCEAPGCDRGGRLRQGLCTLHYQRLMKHGDIGFVSERVYQTGPDSHAWAGDGAAYRTVHSRLDREYGKAKTHTCPCGQQANQWSYDHADPDERIGVVTNGWAVPYSLKPEHYTALCQPCHRKVDNPPARSA